MAIETGGPSPEELGEAPKTERPTALDEKLYGQLKDAITWQAYEYFAGSSKVRGEEYRKMDEDPTYIAELDYPKLVPEGEDIQKITAFEKTLNDARDRIREENPLARDIMAKGWPEDVEADGKTVVDVAYLLRINEKLAEARMVRAASNGDYRKFAKYSSFVYGEPSKDIFSWSVDRIRARNRATLSRSEDPEVRALVEKLNEQLPDVKGQPTPKVFEFPSKKQFAELHEDLVKQFEEYLKIPEEQIPDLLSLPEEERKNFELSPEQQRDIVAKALKRFADGWTADIEEGRGTFSVSQERRKVDLPDKRKLTYQRFKELYMHEILTHVWRRATGEQSNLKLLGPGLRSYEQGEEGITTAREYILRGKVELGIPMGHMAIALARGADGKPRDAREVYNFMKTYYELQGRLRGAPADRAKKDAKEWAEYHMTRTFRGSNLKDKGICLTKDIIYEEGRRLLFRSIKRRGDKAVAYTRIFNVGKFDPTESKAGQASIAILKRLPMFDERLKDAGI